MGQALVHPPGPRSLLQPSQDHGGCPNRWIAIANDGMTARRGRPSREASAQDLPEIAFTSKPASAIQAMYPQTADSTASAFNAALKGNLQAALREIAASMLIQTIVQTWSCRTRRLTSGNEDDVAAVMRCHRSFYSVVAVTGGTQISATKRSLLHQRKKHRHKNQNVNR